MSHVPAGCGLSHVTDRFEATASERKSVRHVNIQGRLVTPVKDLNKRSNYRRQRIAYLPPHRWVACRADSLDLYLTCSVIKIHKIV